jgi:hypothetical protein
MLRSNGCVYKKTSFMPHEMVFETQKQRSFLVLIQNFFLFLTPIYPSVQNNQHIDNLTKHLQAMTDVAFERLTQFRFITTKELRKLKNQERLKSTTTFL